VDALGPVDATTAIDCAKIRATVLEVYKAVRRRCREALVLFPFFLPSSPPQSPKPNSGGDLSPALEAVRSPVVQLQRFGSTREASWPKELGQFVLNHWESIVPFRSISPDLAKPRSNSSAILNFDHYRRIPVSYWFSKTPPISF
jgi:hypothetical protein